MLRGGTFRSFGVEGKVTNSSSGVRHGGREGGAVKSPPPPPHPPKKPGIWGRRAVLPLDCGSGRTHHASPLTSVATY